MPETFYELDSVPPTGKQRDVTVSRAHSDSKKRERALSAYGQIKEGASEEEIEKLRVSFSFKIYSTGTKLIGVKTLFSFCSFVSVKLCVLWGI